MNTRKRPISARILNQWVDAHARQHELSPARVRNWVSHVVLGGALEQSGFNGAGRRFTIKGGVALEMRLRHLARATRDLDLILLASDADPVEELGVALARPYEGFAFRIRGDAQVMPNGACRVEVALQYLGKSWGTVQVDVGRSEGEGTDVEMVEAIPLAPFGLDGPDSLPCLSLPYHVAQKIHGMTLPPLAGRQNERFRDLLDLLLLREWVSDLDAVRRACLDVFETRGTHPWPPRIAIPDHWVGPFQAMAVDVGVTPSDVHSAAIEVRQFLTRIDEAVPWYGELSDLSGLTATTWYYIIDSDGRPRRIPAKDGEHLFTGRYRESEIGPAFQRDPGGVAAVGVVLLLRNRRPAYVDGMATKAIALQESVVGMPVDFGSAVNGIAADILKRAQVSSESCAALSVFLTKINTRLPCERAESMGVSTTQAHWYRVNWRSKWFLWDIHDKQPVSGKRSA